MPSLTAIPVKLAGIAAGILLMIAAFFYVQHLRSDLATAQANVATLNSVNKADQAAMKDLQDTAAKYQAADEHLSNAVRTVDHALARDNAAIAAAGAAQDGTVAPVLSDEMDRLRGDQK